jgi:hypothetical protein
VDRNGNRKEEYVRIPNVRLPSVRLFDYGHFYFNGDFIVNSADHWVQQHLLFYGYFSGVAQED